MRANEYSSGALSYNDAAFLLLSNINLLIG
jgi:hypothetical protein